MSVINTNVSALIAQSALTSNSRAQSTAMQQLSTGLRINGAKDDAAGLAIASKMTSQIRGLDQSVRNANDGISLMQTADGAMTAVSDMLQRMRELSVQASNDTNVSTDRTALNTEFQALTTEIGRIGKTTQWNGMNILDGTANSGTGTFSFQVGANNDVNQRVSVNTGNIATAGASSATEAIVQTSGTPTTSQVTTITLGGGGAAGDKISLNLNGTAYDYTVTTADVGAGDAAAQSISIATNMFNALKGSSLAAGITMTNTSSALVLTGTVATPFSATASDSAGLALLGGANNILTATTANASITAVDTALSSVNATRATLGATINRLTYAADNLTNVSQNTSASRSRIQDTDYAKSSTELARTQIISQAATAMLAQANQSQQSVLALLK